jgi:hypothetical protein
VTGFAIAGARLHGDEDFFRRRLALSAAEAIFRPKKVFSEERF